MNDTRIFFGDFCGDSPFWDPDVSWDNPYPSLTLCFLDVIPAWIPSVYLLCSLLLRPSLLTLSGAPVASPKESKKSKIFRLLKQLVNAVAMVTAIARIAIVADGANVDIFTSFFTSAAPFVDGAMSLACHALLVLLINLTRMKKAADAVVFLFWAIHFLCQLLPFQHYIRVTSGQIPFRSEILEEKLAIASFVTMTSSTVALMLNFVGNSDGVTSPWDSASQFSRLTFFWTVPLLRKGFNRRLTLKDLDDIPLKFKIENLMKKFYEKSFRKNVDASPKEQNSRKTEKALEMSESFPSNSKTDGQRISMTRAFFSCYLTDVVIISLIRLTFVTINLFKPLLLGVLVDHVSSRPNEEADDPIRRQWRWKGLLYAFFLFFLALVEAVAHTLYWWFSNGWGLKLQSTMIVSIYEKSLRLTAAFKQSLTTGEIVNLIGVDARRCFQGVQMLGAAAFVPLQIVLGCWLLYVQIGWSSLAGVACLVALIPLIVVLSYKVRKLQEAHMEFKDERVKTMNEIINNIKVIKFYTWENPFADRVADIRKKEITLFRKQMFFQALMSGLFNTSSVFVGVICLTVYVSSSSENILTAKKVFVTLTLLNNLQYPLWIIPAAVQTLIHTLVSARRVNKFFASEEIEPQIDNRVADGVAVQVGKASFSWAKDSNIFLKDLNFQLNAGSMFAVVGPVGSGKTALLKCLLGEMHKISGKVSVVESVAYVSQQPWIQNGTVRDNILFGQSFDRAKYESIVEACALEPDLSVLPAYDDTEIGERGINLSGGQKLRVSLARAIYADADLYLLDDPLSAVDVHVGRHIFEQVLSSRGLLGRKSRIVVTNVLKYLPLMDSVISLAEGKITDIGRLPDLKRRKSLPLIILDESSPLENDKATQNDRLNEKEGNGKLLTAEEVHHGSINFLTYLSYVKYMGFLVGLAAILFFICAQGLEMGGNLSLSKLTDEIHPFDNTSSANTEQFVNYVTFGLFSGVSQLLGWFFLVVGVTTASQRLHDELTSKVIAYPMSFFDTTPTGRIMNRVSSDIDVIDIQIFGDIGHTCTRLSIVIFSFITIVTVQIWSLAFIPVVLLFFLVVQFVYLRTGRQLRRLESTSRSPILSLFGETLQGITNIRAFKTQRRFVAHCHRLVEENLKAAVPMWSCEPAVTYFLEGASAFMALFVALYCVLDESISAGQAGLSLTYSIFLIMAAGITITWSSRMENDFVAVERVLEYTKMSREASWRNEASKSIEPSWPTKGEIGVTDFSCRYRENLELVLKNLNFRIDGGERVGVVGKTGAGKSSLTLALFRIVEAASGAVSIDGLKTGALGLHDLRSKISIIPQDPVIFSGSLRSNLDPFGFHDDEKLWSALKMAHLKEFVTSLPEGLDHECAEAGENLSVGQRQLVCLARALLKNSKILVMDEATASVDLKTDLLIQKTVREEFVGCTVITIAHRLDTIIDYDKVIVLSDGEIVEFEDPRLLLRNEGSTFYGLAKEAGLV